MIIYGRLLSIFNHQLVDPISVELVSKIILELGSYWMIVGSFTPKYFPKRRGGRLATKYPVKKPYDKGILKENTATAAARTPKAIILLKTVKTVYFFKSFKEIFKRFFTCFGFRLSKYAFLRNRVTKTSKNATVEAYTKRAFMGEDKTAIIDPATKPVKTIRMRRAKGFFECFSLAIPVPCFNAFSISSFISKIYQNKENTYVF